MRAPGEPTPDIPGLRALAGTCGVLAEDLAAAGRSLRRVPKPTVSGYGWRGTADAVGDVLASWSAEVSVIRRVCDELGRASGLSADEMQAAADRMQAAADRTSGRSGGRAPR